ncbi:aminoacyl-tRNA hydrolase [Candidatus Peregrinibacteria bacterium]|nr:aminoacyl-tRNA hydrolase [Candidatus Peregrinibacteria bacterium]
MKLIVGLGNPGKQYEKTRHNAGFIAIDYLARHFGFEKFKKMDKFSSEIAEGVIAGEKSMLVKPLTYMNLSGQAVSSILNFYKIPIEDFILIYDDAYVDFGSMRIKPDGSSGGHNGVQSVIDSLATQGFTRIRLGIKQITPFAGPLEAYVLGKLSDNEHERLNDITEKLPEILKSLFDGKIEEVMNENN